MISAKKTAYILLEKVTAKVILHLLKVSSSFGSFLVGVLVAEAFDKVVVPLLNMAIVQGHLYYDANKGRIKVKRLNEARKGGSNANYDRAVDDILQ